MASTKLIVLAVLVAIVALADAYPRYYILDDQDVEFAPAGRVRRDDAYAAAPSTSYGSTPYQKGRVGPVYTFVKTDPKANFKWGVRHQVGTQYAG